MSLSDYKIYPFKKSARIGFQSFVHDFTCSKTPQKCFSMENKPGYVKQKIFDTRTSKIITENKIFC